MFSRILITIIITVYDQDIKLKALLTFGVVFIYYYGINKYRPFLSHRLNIVEMQSMIVCLLSILCGLFIYNNEYIGYRIIAAIIVGFLNIQFIF